ncbi:MAG TPA: hypothetical protein VLC09_04710, partial [Polyangiaceae bacterium]|nr:hypothetical protein [Polyangiaceae bacterium]
MSSNSAPAALLVLPLLVLSGCAAEVGADERRVGETQQALVTEDALSSAFGRFRTEFVELGRDVAFDVGLAPLDAFGTENLGSASVVLSFEKNGDVYTGQFGVQKGPEFELPNTLAYDLFAVRNVSGAGRSARAEAGDQFTKLGTFRTDGSFSSQGVSFRTSGAVDFLLLTRAGVSPASGGVAVGNLSLFERRFFAGAFGWAQPTAAPLATAAVPTTDPLVQQGSRVFFEETFGGNGRTCGTCHRAENNFTIDAAFLAGLPASDPLFAAARQVPGLEGLNPNAPLAQIQSKQTLISENLDGTSHAPVFRSVQHTLGMAATTTRPRVPILAGQVLQSPPDERTGWSGDGAPGRGTLHDFAVGAIVQHLTRDVARRPGVDFRLPTQEELDQLEAFQLSLGRSREINARTLAFAEPAAESGKQLFNTQGLCFVCHDNAGARSAGPAIFNNVTLDQGVERRPETVALGLTPDGGFGRSDAGHGFGNGEFNVQSLIEAADTAPFFHNNSAATLEDAVRHYTT